ncbi:hypothetical protein OH77DRAFT_34567 [Trametes cingulata]|nr:hypothetical protein OH77DRAFT_34567 [Trametes cingulata]
MGCHSGMKTSVVPASLRDTHSPLLAQLTDERFPSGTHINGHSLRRITHSLRSLFWTLMDRVRTRAFQPAGCCSSYHSAHKDFM